MVSKRERLEAAIAKDVADRPPFALWRHFPVDDQTPNGLAESTALYQARYDYDFVKVTPASSFCLLDWGVEDEWNGNPEGTRDYTQLSYCVRDSEKLNRSSKRSLVLSPKRKTSLVGRYCLSIFTESLER
jgi:uroporphyrinogen decarboxylase